MKHALLLLSFIVFLVACTSALDRVTPAVTTAAQVTDAPIGTFTSTPLPTLTNTAAPTATSTFTPTSTGTPTPSRTPTNTPRPTATFTPSRVPTSTPDTTALGNPSTPVVEYPSRLPANFFTYSPQESYIYERILHGRPITVVFGKNSIFTEAEREELSNYIFDTWLSIWKIFGGYRTQLFLLRLGPEDNPEGETSVGFRCSEQFLINEKMIEQSDWYQPLAHGIFHAWLGETIVTATDGETWFMEGATQYYGNRFASRKRYLWEMNAYVDYYNGLIGTTKDISLVDSGIRYKHGGVFEDKLHYYRKGALVIYLMDIQMIRQGYNLDHLMRHMYLNFGLSGKPFTTDDVKVALEEITGQEWQTFFDLYVYGIEPLSLGSGVQFPKH